MARTPSNMVDLGSIAPNFNLINTVDDKFISSDDCFSKKGTLIMFICNHCPFVIHVIDEIIKISNQYTNEIDFVAISSNDVINYPDDAPELMKKLATDKSFNFPYLYDENQDVAKAYDAACTPDFFLYNDEKKLIYRGQLDDSRPGNEKSIDGKDLRNALDCLIKNVKNNFPQKPSIGCNIKWK
jgi:thiol-disulfide isomerase/thioredoxin